MFQRWIDIDETRSCLIIGPRRCGKTTLLKNRYPHLNYVTLDDLDYLQWAQNDPKGLVAELGREAIIDEVQRCPSLMIAVKYAIDNLGARFFMTGSSSIGLLDAVSDTLAGRINIYSLPTACWGEHTDSRPDHDIFLDKMAFPKIKAAQRRLQDAMTFGLFPEVATQNTPEEKRAVLTNYKNTYFIRDLMQLANIENLDGLLSIFHNLARSLGSHLEISNFAREAGISHVTAKKYLNSLLQSQLTFKLLGYQYGPAKRFIKAAKTYFADNGIITSLNISVSEGQLLENFVISELEKRRKLGFIPSDRFFYYKSVSGREIDLVFEADGTVYAIEIKATKSPRVRDIRNLVVFGESLKRPVRLFLFYLGEEYKTIKNVHIIPVSSIFLGR